MNTILVIGIIWTLYGVAGLFGLQKYLQNSKQKHGRNATFTIRVLHGYSLEFLGLYLLW